MKVSLVIPAKGTSERVKNKNLIVINGKTLVRLACEKALMCTEVDNIYLDTESEAIIRDVIDLEKKGLRILKRPKDLADNEIGANEMMIYALHQVDETDVLCQTFCTSPLITHTTIDDCISKFRKTSNDSFLTVLKTQEYFWFEGKPLNYTLDNVPNSFDILPYYMETHGLYGITTKALLEHKTRIGSDPLLLPISKIESIDINETDDVEIVSRFLR
jgi:CMP-N-acetylneuraminic acid synthetase